MKIYINFSTKSTIKSGEQRPHYFNKNVSRRDEKKPWKGRGDAWILKENQLQPPRFALFALYSQKPLILAPDYRDLKLRARGRKDSCLTYVVWLVIPIKLFHYWQDNRAIVLIPSAYSYYRQLIFLLFWLSPSRFPHSPSFIAFRFNLVGSFLAILPVPCHCSRFEMSLRTIIMVRSVKVLWKENRCSKSEPHLMSFMWKFNCCSLSSIVCPLSSIVWQPSSSFSVAWCLQRN